MQPDLRLIPKPELSVSARLCGMVGLLRMNTDELTRHMKDMAARNPLLDFQPGRSRASDLPYDPGIIADQSLYSHVLHLIHARFDDGVDLRVAYAFANALEPSGWLDQPPHEIAIQAGVDQVRAQAVLERLQEFEPTGLFARDLADCLRLQLRERGEWSQVTETVLSHLSVFQEGGIAALVQVTQLSQDQIADVMTTIRTCDPKPGAVFQADDPSLHRRPDVVVTKEAGTWLIELEGSNLPRLNLAQTDLGCDPVMARLRAEARWLVNAVRLRNQMTLDVARTVVSHQVGFLERGVGGLRPLRRCDVAKRLGVHESTVGRVATGLLVQTPGQMLELTAFFSRALGQGTLRPTSRRKVQMLLRQMIANEDRTSPLTDKALASKLDHMGSCISRRTVAKYRQVLGIGGAAMRALTVSQPIKER